MRIGFDATPAAVQRAGVGRYSRELLRALLELPNDDEYALLTASPPAAASVLLDELPPGRPRDLRRLPVPDRLVTIGWQRLRLPLRAETLLGPFDVFHGPDFVVPPSKRPRVVTIHDLSYLLAPQHGDPRLVEFLTHAVPRSLRAADRIIAVSAAVAREINDAYPFTSGRVVAIPNGVRLPEPIPDSVSASVGRPRVLFLGTVEPRKGVETLIDAVRIVRDQHRDVELVIAGRIGWRAEGIVADMQSAIRDGFVRHLDGPSDEQVRDAFRSAALFAYPSRYEGFGLPILEAMAHGLPVVTSDIAALRETAGDAAVLVPPDDPGLLASAISELIDDPSRRDELAARGLARVAAYSWRATAEATRRVYAAATSGKSR